MDQLEEEQDQQQVVYGGSGFLSEMNRQLLLQDSLQVKVRLLISSQ